MAKQPPAERAKEALEDYLRDRVPTGISADGILGALREAQVDFKELRAR